MLRKLVPSLGIILVLLVALAPNVARAHQSIKIGDYNVEYGWVNEPVIVGQPNAVVLNITKAVSSTATLANVDVSNLKIEAIYGPDDKVLTLQPLGENTPGQFVAPLLPTKAGQITIRLSGKIDTASIPSTDVQPEEVKTADTVQFPPVAVAAASGSEGLSLAGWLGVAGIVFGLIGTVLGAVAIMRRR